MNRKFQDELFDADDDPYHEEICNYLSDQTGFCIESYEIELPEPDPELKKATSKTSAIIQSTDFKPRQMAYIVTLDGTRSENRICTLQECIVMSAGRRYVKTMPDANSRANKKFENLTGTAVYLSIVTSISGNAEMLVPTREQAEAYIEKRENRLYIRNKLLDGEFINSLTEKQLKELRAVITA